jgi:hypothetical protein
LLFQLLKAAIKFCPEIKETMNRPKSRNENIVVQEMEKEILIYDLKTNKAFCLNETSALIWNLCDGKNSIAEVSRILTKKLKQPITEDFVWLALDNFKKDNLLEQNEQFEINFNGLSRRQVIKKVGLASLAALPVIASVTVPASGAAGSCVPLGNLCRPGGSVGNCCRGQAFCEGVCQACLVSGTNILNCNINSVVCGFCSYVCCSGTAMFSGGLCTCN